MQPWAAPRRCHFQVSPWQTPCGPGMEEEWLCGYCKVANLRRPNERGVFFGFLPDYNKGFWFFTAYLLEGFSCSQFQSNWGPWGNITFRKLLVIDMKSWVLSQREQPLSIRKSPWNTLFMPYYFRLEACKKDEKKKKKHLLCLRKCII